MGREIKCRRCGKDREHYAKGMCKPCYSWVRTKNNPKSYKKCKKWIARWGKDHPDKRARYAIKHHLKKVPKKKRREFLSNILKELEGGGEK